LNDLPQYVFDGQPAAGETREVAPGVFWLRMPLPFKLDHINLWLLKDGDGWTIVDCGINRDPVKAAWERVFAQRFGGRPLKRVIVTHYHPDHVGLAGWLTQRFGVRLWMPLAEWAFARMISQDQSDASHEAARAFYRAAGFDEAQMAAFESRRDRYAANVSPIPAVYRRYGEGGVIDIDGRGWRVVVGTGHSPEHACLYCTELNVLISGDQILPKISPNVSLWPSEPEGNPLRLFLDSLNKFRDLPADTLILPSHNWPFLGLHARLDALAHHHDERLAATWATCAEPASGVDVLKRLFQRELDAHQLMFAIGESLAHLHFLAAEGRLERTLGPDGIHRFRQIASAAHAAA
jgi:glyoxylase-like metal-dependent hydrolase (beta-lactamase superfamily II)